MHSSTITRLWQCIIVLVQSISPHSRCLVCGVSVSCSYAGFGFAFEGEIATILGIYNLGYFDPQNTYHYSTCLFCSCSSEAHHWHTLWD